MSRRPLDLYRSDLDRSDTDRTNQKTSLIKERNTAVINFKKVISMLLMLVMVISLSISVVADNTATANNGKITITNATPGQTYTIYRILQLESYNEVNDAYSYKATLKWEDFVEASEYLITGANEYVTWDSNKKTAEDVANFAALAIEYAKAPANNITPNSTTDVKKAETTEVVFENLPLGYYLVDSTLGTLCTLNTTNTAVSIQDKNVAPSLDKIVQEDSDKHWYTRNDADIGQTITFSSQIIVRAGAENYVLHDKMSTGLTFTGIKEVRLKVANSTTEELVDAQYYTVETDQDTNGDYKSLNDGCIFHIKFHQDWLDTLNPNDMILVYYTAELNENAIIGGDDTSGGNPNEAWLDYGTNSQTTHDITRTYTWEMNILKFTNTGTGETPLAGAQFVIKTEFRNGETQYAIIKDGKIKGWTMNIDYPDGSSKQDVVIDADNDHIPNEENDTVANSDTIYATILETPATGELMIKGLDGFTTYKIEEVKAPAGYNVLTSDVIVSMDNRGKITSTTATIANNQIKIENNAGTILPSTGGTGTTILYAVGAVLLLGAAVLLITKKRMDSAE